MSKPVRLMVLASLALAAVVLPLSSAAAQDPNVAPTTTLSNGGRTVSDGTRSLSVSQVRGLDPAGQAVSLTGAGFEPTKGIYVAFCVIPPTNQQPTPCGGGNVHQTGDTGASMWLRSDDYGARNGATPFEPGGSFSGTITISAIIEVPADGRQLDCRQLRCAIVTRTDHKALTDRSLDLFVPVTFAEQPPASPTTTAPPPPPAPPTTVPALQATQVAPAATVAPDGLAVSDGTRRLAADEVADLDPVGAEVTVTGAGFDASKGIYVGLCAVPSPDPALPAGAATAPGPCSAPAEGGAAWVSSNPPDYAGDAAEPYGDGGSFETTLELRAVIDSDHDCRIVACALVTRHDDTNRDDRTQDLYLPLTFAAGSAAEDDAAPAAAVAVDDADGGTGGGSGAVPLVAGGAGVVALGALGLAWWRRRGATT